MAVSNSRCCRKLSREGMECSDETFRKIVEYIRKEHLIRGVCASRNGYYVANTIDDLRKYEGELSGRVKSQLATLQAIRDDIKYYVEQSSQQMKMAV